MNLFPKRVLVKSFVGELVRSFDVRKTLLPPVPQVPETTRTFLAALGVQQSHDSRPPLSPRNVLFRLPLLFPSPHGSSTTNCFEGDESTSIGRCAAITCPAVENTLYAREHPEEANGIERALRFRESVGEEFERLICGQDCPGHRAYRSAL